MGGQADFHRALGELVAFTRQSAAGGIPIIGIAGPQGSGKTTMARALSGADPSIAHLSLDDVYLGAEARKKRASVLHPLFATRGVPGTHDIDLLNTSLTALEEAGPNSHTPIPAFDKVADDRVTVRDWPRFVGRPALILVDGWCIGATPQADADLKTPVNKLEAEEDIAGTWRRAANNFLKDPYQQVFGRMNAILCLRAPAFEIVPAWRSQQEEGLLGRALSDKDRQRIARFVAHFERITRHMMAGGRRAELEVQLDEQRRIAGVKRG